jgi:hypothetical protein
MRLYFGVCMYRECTAIKNISLIVLRANYVLGGLSV